MNSKFCLLQLLRIRFLYRPEQSPAAEPAKKTLLSKTLLINKNKKICFYYIQKFIKKIRIDNKKFILFKDLTFALLRPGFGSNRFRNKIQNIRNNSCPQMTVARIQSTLIDFSVKDNLSQSNTTNYLLNVKSALLVNTYFCSRKSCFSAIVFK